jgi:hypothetical protein
MGLIQVLIRRGDVEDVSEAKEMVNEMKQRVLDGEDPEEILYEIGLEPDYIFDLLD